jgi:hypothetical protein
VSGVSEQGAESDWVTYVLEFEWDRLGVVVVVVVQISFSGSLQAESFGMSARTKKKDL